MTVSAGSSCGVVSQSSSAAVVSPSRIMAMTPVHSFARRLAVCLMVSSLRRIRCYQAPASHGVSLQGGPESPVLPFKAHANE